MWCPDFTYIRLAHGFVYLTAVMDRASHYVVSLEVSVTMDDDFCVNALKSALHRHNTHEIFNRDQGGQYTGTVPELLSCLKDYFEFYNFERPHQSLVAKRLQKFNGEEKLPRRQRK